MNNLLLSYILISCKESSLKGAKGLKKHKRLWILILLLGLIAQVSFAFGEVDVPNPMREFYVDDFAKVLSPELEKWMVQTNLNYEKTEEKPQIVVVTISSLQGLTIEDYAVKLFEKWKIGNKKYDNGILVLVSTEDREIRIEVGYGLEGAIPDGRTGEILQYIGPDLTMNDYEGALKKAFYLIGQDINREYEYNDKEIWGSNESHSIMERDITNIPTKPLPLFLKIIGLFGILILIWLDYRFLGGLILGTVFRMFLLGGRGGHGGGFRGGNSGGGGRSGGGGSSSKF